MKILLSKSEISEIEGKVGKYFSGMVEPLEEGKHWYKEPYYVREGFDELEVPLGEEMPYEMMEQVLYVRDCLRKDYPSLGYNVKITHGYHNNDFSKPAVFKAEFFISHNKDFDASK